MTRIQNQPGIPLRSIAIVCLLAGLWAGPAPARPTAYLETPLTIDGQLDPAFAAVPSREFANKLTFDNPPVDPVRVSYRLGYDLEYLYLHIETDADEFSFHPRGSIWGDGFRLLLGLPGANLAMTRFVEIDVSPRSAGDGASEAVRLLNRDGETVNRRLGGETKFAMARTANGTAFELALSWDEVNPYHPLFTPSLGFNLYFAKGFEDEDAGHFPHGYQVAMDEGVWDESMPHRYYSPLSFEDLPESAEIRSFRMPDLNPEVWDYVMFEAIVSHAPPEGMLLESRIMDDAGLVVHKETVTLVAKKPLLRQTHFLEKRLEPGHRYTLEIRDGTHVSAIPFVTMPALEFARRDEELRDLARTTDQPTSDTLRWRLRDLCEQFGALEPYDDATALLGEWNAFQVQVDSSKDGLTLPVPAGTAVRRGFESALDSTFQPYSIRLPPDYDPGSAYPLLVFLHGSAATDEGLLDIERGNGDWIELAPYGRDKYRAYSDPASQTDITEAINYVIANYAVEESRIVIAGFSMGGYGALRTHYENPSRYRGVAVFAGHPNLASEWLGQPHPNFLEPQYANSLQGKPVFIYHGTKDEALDPAAARKLAASLEKAGAQVEAHFVEGRGHVYQDESTHASFGAWLDLIAEQ